MFVYQNANRDICVTFKSRMPVRDPEYVIAIDHENGIIKVNGEEMVPSTPAEDDTTSTEGDTTDPESAGTQEPTEEPEQPVDPADPDVTDGDEGEEIEE